MFLFVMPETHLDLKELLERVHNKDTDDENVVLGTANATINSCCLAEEHHCHNILMLFREKALRNFGYNISFIV